MANISDRIKEAQERVAQAQRRRVLQENRAKEQRRKIDTRRKIIVGGIVIKYLPWVLNLQPQMNEAENNKEFAELKRILSELSDVNDNQL